MPLFDKDGRVRGSVAAYLEVTEQRNAEVALRRSEALAAAGRLANAVAHELNNPLQAATNLMYLFHSAPSTPAELKPLALDAERQLARVGALLKQTLEIYSKLAAAHSDSKPRSDQ